MPITIDAFVEAYREVDKRLKSEGLLNDISSRFDGLAYMATGGFRNRLPDQRDLNEHEFMDALASGEIHAIVEDRSLQWLRHLVDVVHLNEEFLVIGIVRYIENFLEDQIATQSATRRTMREERELQRDRLLDPHERRKSADNINRMLPLEVPRMHPDNLLGELDEMYERFSPPATPERMRMEVRRLHLWRELAVPLVQPSGF